METETNDKQTVKEGSTTDMAATPTTAAITLTTAVASSTQSSSSSSPPSSSSASSQPAEIDLTADDDEEDDLVLHSNDLSIPHRDDSSASPSRSAADASSTLAPSLSRPRKRKLARPASPFDPDCVEVIDCTDETKEYNPPARVKRIITYRITHTTAAAADYNAVPVEPAPPPPPPPPHAPTIVEVEKSLNCLICLDAMNEPVATTCGSVVGRNVQVKWDT